MHLRFAPPIERFMAKIERIPGVDCWIWVAAAKANGYGTFAVAKNELWPAHRFSYTHFKGPIPDGLHVRHTCDVPTCVNPDHLLIGTALDNMRDKISRGRGCVGVGERHGNAVLNDALVREMVASPLCNRCFANTHQLRIGTVRSVRDGTTWRHITGLTRPERKQQ